MTFENHISIEKITAVCTGHRAINQHAEKLGNPFNSFSRSCLDSTGKNHSRTFFVRDWLRYLGIFDIGLLDGY